MARYYGIIGYVESIETTPGVWTDKVTERPYFGNVERNTSRWNTSSDSTNDDLNINNEISIIADQFAYQNFHNIKYAEFMGVNWKVTNAEFSNRPRITLTLGGKYNG